ncbi:hypothetical protein [Tunturiibacter gelidoferens]|jgi:hypothetical protein|uniref:DUF4252 domain-containing protein n=1 Tax=Tunturiibacter gelidiferens TaxID=3069689 RepID=A0A9X0U4C7_9BACT|nr:hypothetical protein [Edaphobacter lichenicola]MBB5328855.1 hypothetical protein [Edaphobacter lichenicola]
MKLRPVLFALVLSTAAAIAQPPAGPPPPPPPLDIQGALMNLADQPATHTSFSFDRSMIQIAQNLLESNGMDANRAPAALTGISVDNYRYPRPAFYTPENMDAIIASYNAAGWKHLVNANQNSANTAQPRNTVTDLWLHFAGADITGVTVLTRSPRDMSVIQIACELRPLDLVHLSGHFGIPKVDPSAVMVPAPPGR